MRVFYAFDLDDAFLDGAATLVEVLRGRLTAKWCARDTLHVTARFVGEVDDVRVLPLAEIVFRLASGRPAPTVRASHLGGFPDDRRARVVYAALSDDGTMAAVAREVENAVTALGHPSEERAYTPHLTLARTKSPLDLTLSRDVPVALEGRAVALTLYRSVGGGGVKYEPIARRSLDS